MGGHAVKTQLVHGAPRAKTLPINIYTKKKWGNVIERLFGI
jgi:hypothetical protein